MTPPLDWLSRLLSMMTVRGQLEIRCSYGAPWLVAYGDSNAGEMPYHVVLRGSAILETPGMGAAQPLVGGGASAQLTGLVALMRGESNASNLGGYAIMNALSAALFALTLRSANDLLTDVRMTMAANELKKPSVSTEVVAQTVGAVRCCRIRPRVEINYLPTLNPVHPSPTMAFVASF
jgi:hypothetical protein